MIITVICCVAIILFVLEIQFSKFTNLEKAIQKFSQSNRPRIKIIYCLGLNRIEIVKNANTVRPKAVITKSEQIASEKKQIAEIRSPQVGFFHLTFETEGKPFVELGRQINSGDDFGLIVCNLLHTADRIKSEVNGTVIEILAEDGQAVEYEQVLIRIEIQ